MNPVLRELKSGEELENFTPQELNAELQDKYTLVLIPSNAEAKARLESERKIAIAKAKNKEARQTNALQEEEKTLMMDNCTRNADVESMFCLREYSIRLDDKSRKLKDNDQCVASRTLEDFYTQSGLKNEAQFPFFYRYHIARAA